MPLQHFIRSSRQVHLGGRRWLGFRFGGVWVTVSPLSAVNFGPAWQILGVLCSDLETATAEEIAAQVGEYCSRPELRPLLAPLWAVVCSPSLTEEQSRHLTKDEATALFRAFLEVHDLDFLRGGLGAGKKKRKDGEGVSLECLAHHIVEECGGSYTHHDLLVSMPFQEMLAIAESSRMVQNLRQGKPADAEPIDQAELARFAQNHPGLCVE